MIHHQYSRETHHKAMPSICQLLLARERGAKSDQLETLAQMLSEEQLVGQLKIPESVANIPDSSRSVFAIEFSHDGSLAAVSHTNRTVSLLKVANMKKISEIHQEHDDRSVWTIEFHPSDKNILAMGTLAGRVSVYTSGVLFRTYQHPTTPITSLTFHHLNSYLCFAVENRLYVWDWEADRLINEPLQCADQERIRYVKFNPLNNTLITGITKAPILEFSIYPQRAASFSALHLLHTFLSTVHFMLEQVETFATATSCMDNQESKPHVWNYLIKYLIDHHQRHGHKYVNSPTNVDDYQFWGIDSSLDLFIRRLDTLVATNSTYEFDNHRLEKYMDNIQGVLDFFTTINDQLIEDSQNAGSFVRIRFDERKIDKIVRTMYGLLYTLNREDVIEHDLKFYLDDERLLDKVALSIPTEYKKHFNLQVWDLDVDQQIFPRLTNAWSNIIATCYIHNDSTISLAACGTRIATFKTEIFTKIIEIRSLEEHNLGALIHIFDTSRSFVSLSFSPTSQLLLVGVRAFYHCGTILKMEPGQQKMTIARRLDDSDHQMDINCAKWAPNACDGILVGHRNHCLRYVNFRSWSNIIATCYIHNDSTISLAACGTRIATFKTEIFTKIIEIRSLEEHNLGALIHIFDTSRSFVSLSFSPTSQLLLVGVRAFYHCGTILKMEPGQQKMIIARRLDDSDHQMDINCAKWAPNACDGILVGHRNHCLRYVNFRCKVRSQTLKTK